MSNMFKSIEEIIKQQKITNIYLEYLLNAMYCRPEYRLIGLEELQEVREKIEELDNE